MSFSIPNLADAFNSAQAMVDKVDVDILVAGHKGDCVVSGCAVTAQGSPDMTVAVAVGAIRINGAVIVVSAGNVTVSAADGTNPRFDLITVNDSGTKACTAGTAAASPVFPAIPANSVVLAAVYVPANDTDIDANQIVDKQVIGGASGLRTTYAARPAAGTAGRIWVQSDGPFWAFDNGSVWLEYFGSFPLTTPVSGDFSWVNQGSPAAAVDTTYGGILLTCAADGAQSWRIRKKAAPATPYHIEVLLSPKLLPGAAYPQCGVGFREAGTDKLEIIKLRSDGNMAVTASSSPTSETANDFLSAMSTACPYIFFRIGADGTNVTYDFSFTGVPGSWLQVLSHAKTARFTTAPDEVLFAIDPRNATYAAGVHILSWKETA